MAFKRMDKGYHMIGLDSMEISVTKSGFSFGRKIAKHFTGYTCAEIYFDIEENRVGFKPTNDVTRGFKFNKSGNSLGLSAQRAIKRLILGKYQGRIEGDMVVFNAVSIAHKK